MILWLYCCSVLRRNIKKLDFLRNAINRLLFNDFFSTLFILEEWYLLVINKDEDRFSEAKYHDILLQCICGYSGKIQCGFYADISPSFGNLSWIACPHLPPTSRWDVVHSLCHQKKVILTINVNRTPFNWDEATIVSVASGNLT